MLRCVLQNPKETISNGIKNIYIVMNVCNSCEEVGVKPDNDSRQKKQPVFTISKATFHSER